MTPGNLELVQILASWAVAAPAVIAIVRIDESRLPGEALARAWPAVSRDSAFVLLWMLGFHPVLLAAFFLVHFVRTRRPLVGVLLGVMWTCLVVALEVAAQWAAAAVVDGLGP